MKNERKLFTALLLSTAVGAFSGAFAQEPAPEVTDEIVVRGVNIPDEKRATSEISAVLDEASFERTGDSDIGDALRRVTGLSLSQGRFVIVRGLNERYSSVTINGSPLPSPEPLRRVVPLDIIPTNILSGTLVQKTYSPEFAGEFGGGLVELRTKSLPDETYFQVEGSLGLDLSTSAREGLVHQGGTKDWIGFDDGTRNLPDPLAGVFLSGAITPANQDLIDASIEGSDTALISSTVINPNWGINTSFGSTYELNDTIAIGGNFALGYDQNWQTREGRREQGLTGDIDSSGPSGGAPQVTLESQLIDFRSTQQTVETNAIASVGAQIGDNHEISFTNFILRSTVKDSRVSIGQDGDDLGLELNRSNLEFFERQVWQSQLRGDHVIPSLNDLSIVWRVAYGEAFRDAPYQREYTYIRNINDPSDPFRYDANGLVGSTPNTLSFSKISDQNEDAGIDIVAPLTVDGNIVELKFGYAFLDKQRKTVARNYEYQSNIAVPSTILTSRIDQLLAPSVVSTPIFDLSLLQSQIDLDNSNSELQVHAGYGGVNVEAGPYIRISAGVRYEDGDQRTSAFSTTTPAASFSETSISESYFLPAATVTWNPIEDVQVRVGYSQTITRPQFRELTPAFFLDDDTDLFSRGNPFLVNSELRNYDARAEYYFGRGQFITIGAFYKDIDKPIEEQFARDLGGIPVISFINAPSAKLYGGEFEFERNFPMSDLLGEGRWESADLVLKTNYTYSKSEVSNEGDVTVAQVSGATGAVPSLLPGSSVFADGRALQGQSKHLFNIQIGWEDSEADSRGTLLLNWASSRIRNVELLIGGGVQAPRVVESPPITLDFVFSRNLETYFGSFDIGLKAKNLLGDDYKATQTFADGTVVPFDTYNLGRELSVSLGKRF